MHTASSLRALEKEIGELSANQSHGFLEAFQDIESTPGS
jgi:hypothetical protein